MTGCAGFIGSALTERLLAAGHSVTGYDNLSTGREDFLQSARRSEHFTFVRGDILDGASLRSSLHEIELVFHLAANADVRFGTTAPHRDLEQNTLGTHTVLESMRLSGVRRIVFASTGSVYGESHTIPTPEDAPFPVQTSLYAASKLAAEALITAYCTGFEFQAYILRLVSILGERYTHGHVFDFCKQLAANPHRLQVLGNGRQRKSYLHIDDCINAIVTAVTSSSARINIFNLGTEDYCDVRQSIGWICETLSVRPEIEYGSGDRGWVGDSPFICLDTARIRALGWQPKYSIREGVVATVKYLQAHPQLLSVRT